MNEINIIKVKEDINIYIHNIFHKSQEPLILQNIQIDINYLIGLIFNINNIVDEHLYSKRKEIRESIANNTFTILDLNNYIKYFIHNINCINNLLKSLNDNILKQANIERYEKNIDTFISLILNDIKIFNFLGKIFIDFDNIYKYHIEILKLINNVKCLWHFNFNKYEIFINKISNLFVNKLYNNLVEYNFHNNINHIYKLNYMMDYIKNINKYYCCIVYSINRLIGPILYNNILYIINNNTISEIAIVFNNSWQIIYSFYKDLHYNNQIINNIILLLKKSTNIDDIINIFNIIISCFVIWNNNHLNLLKIVLNDKFNNNIDLLYNIMNYYHNTIYEEHNILSDWDLINPNEKSIIYNKYIILLTIILNIDDKDIILEIHYALLINKLFNNYNKKYFLELLVYEKNIFNNIINKKFKDNKSTNTFIKLINDLSLSYKINSNFLNNNILNNINIIITSYENPIINHDEGYIQNNVINNNYQIDNILTNYNNNYERINNNSKHLLWYLHYGEINITYNNINIKMLPIHFIILELFTNVDQILFDEINNLNIFLNYSSELKFKIIQSLIDSNLLYINNNYLVLNQNSNFDSNLIEIYLNTTNYKNIININELNISREDITKSNIMHILKTQNLSYSDLFSISLLKIKVFKLTKEIFNKVLDYLIKMDYIIYSDNLYIKMY